MRALALVFIVVALALAVGYGLMRSMNFLILGIATIVVGRALICKGSV